MKTSQQAKALIEVCVESFESAQIAIAAGCHRLELCDQLAVGGVTPSMDWVRSTVQSISQPIVALVRPRAGDFCYDRSEQAVMIRSAAALVELGVAGVAVGAICNDGWDLAFMQRISVDIRGCELVAHRAVDELLGSRPATTARLSKIIQPLIDLGFHRILTSGGYPDAALGSDNIRKMVEFAAGRIEILPGGGVTPQNACRILTETAAGQLHGSFRRQSPDNHRVEVDADRLRQVVAEVTSVEEDS